MSKRSATMRRADGRRMGPRGGLPATEPAALRSFGGGDPNDDGGRGGWSRARVQRGIEGGRPRVFIGHMRARGEGRGSRSRGKRDMAAGERALADSCGRRKTTRGPGVSETGRAGGSGRAAGPAGPREREREEEQCWASALKKKKTFSLFLLNREQKQMKQKS
jgi:hypothetical protein